MTRCCLVLTVVLAISVYAITARDVPKENKDTIGLTDQKNVYTFGGTGGYSGFGNNGLPIGGMGTGVGVGGDFGGANGVGGVGMGYQFGGPGGPAGGVGTFGGLGNGFGGLPPLGGGGIGGGGPVGGGVGGGVLPHP
ncbi:glycine-rich protein 5-like [Helianthus annuus]|uniref:glycine-rich protein 5-like n=1 Tax=Helianthus annuus TaxID=4232 RepID=UPI000B8F2987|nr:glycine-rich protein 5-like [Helianthus annuus]